MFISKKDYDLVCDRNTELHNEIYELEDKLEITEKNELKLLNENTKLKRKQRQITKLLESNTYNNAELRLRKIKEVITSDQTIR